MSKEKNNKVKNNDTKINETPLSFEENDTHSFSQWLLAKVKKIRSYNSEEKIINNFIKHEHEIRVKK